MGVCAMRALTLWQPWASLIAEGVKTIETRSWPAPKDLVGERFAIHAAAKMTREQRSIAYADPIGRALNDVGIMLGGDCAALPLGAVVATARLAACLPMVPWNDPQQRNGEHRLFVDERSIWRTNPRGGGPLNMTTQLPYGDFAPGRWGWLLADVEKLPEPVPAKGRQRLWRWEP